MTLEEAIKHAEEMAKRGGQCGEEHAQLAGWLKELQEWRAAEPEKHTEECAETHACDCISRQAAIDALERIFDRCEEIEAHLPEGDPDRTGYKMYPDYMTVWKYLHQLPSAQPEVIRCKDCKWKQGSECVRFADVRPFPDDYCSRAERKEV